MAYHAGDTCPAGDVAGESVPGGAGGYRVDTGLAFVGRADVAIGRRISAVSLSRSKPESDSGFVVSRRAACGGSYLVPSCS